MSIEGGPCGQRHPEHVNSCDFTCSFLQNYVIIIKIQRRQPYVDRCFAGKNPENKKPQHDLYCSVRSRASHAHQRRCPGAVWRHAPRRRRELPAVLIRHSGRAEGRRSRRQHRQRRVCRPWLRRRGRDGGRARPRAGAWLLCPARSHARRRGAQCRGDGPRLLRRHPGRGEDLHALCLRRRAHDRVSWQRLGQALHAVLQGRQKRLHHCPQLQQIRPRGAGPPLR